MGDDQSRLLLTTVVVPLDGSSLAANAVAPARALAEATGARLRLMTAEPLTFWHERIDQADAYLKEEAAKTGYRRVETLVVGDHAAREAILAQNEAPGALVCMATHGRSGLRHAALGSIAEAVLHDSNRPVLLVGPRVSSAAPAVEHGNVLVTVDGSPTSETIVPTVAGWVHALRLRPWVVEVLPPTVSVEPSEAAAESALVRHVAETLDGETPEWEVLHESNTADAVLDYARRLPAALIAMATHGRTGLARVAIGSVAMQVVQQSTCPILLRRASDLIG